MAISATKNSPPRGGSILHQAPQLRPGALRRRGHHAAAPSAGADGARGADGLGAGGPCAGGWVAATRLWKGFTIWLVVWISLNISIYWE